LEGNVLVEGYISYPYNNNLLKKLFNGFILWGKLIKYNFYSVVSLVSGDRPTNSMIRDRIFFKLCGISRCIGFGSMENVELSGNHDNYKFKYVMHEAECRLERLKIDGIDISEESDLSLPFYNVPDIYKITAEKWLNCMRKYPDRSLVAICPGTKQQANSWPLDRFIKVGNYIISLGKYELIVIGGPAEKGDGEKMIKAWGTGINAAGLTSVIGSAALIQKCKLLIGLDTGTTHLAASSGIPCVALYGGKNRPGKWDPLGNKHVVIRNSVQCVGCNLYDCKLLDHPCMTGITVERVIHGIQKLLR